ncbi:response regulator receiver domain-containing protein [Algoriphagus ratkowskyi]|uniref:Response regulator n=1 Tax=Algoriphagus ratkowskyi TaxID=57028 RepID=A0A2W7RB16_9BACT|nr:response regulator [Algoriphagus ratkowskyi]PZX58233.1 response regulator receiver domain-containing protein [Algoriphagus ratkowskyi]TXD77886.1 response regulator [Algoriphagus ratkowskyi]
MATKPISILLVEDNEGDVLLITDALSEAEFVNKIEIARDGAEAISLLFGIADTNCVALPDLILLDINLPKKNGYEVISSMADNALLRDIPVIILTTSSSEMDIIKAKKLEDYCYIIKPIEIDEYLQVVSKIEEFWISTLISSKTRA